MREWLVIEKTISRVLFGSDVPGAHDKGYIPRDAAEQVLGRKIEDGRTTWFSDEDSKKMRAHPEWRDTIPPGARTEGGDGG